jgi:[acyl-carrier-protein] S-malonyltransferase
MGSRVYEVGSEKMKTACLFPGQGSQFVGMAANLIEEHESIAKRFKLADDILGYSLTNIMFKGPEEDLKQTRYTQPAIFLHSVALFESLDLKPDMVAGHSLGEFSALFAVKVLSFEAALGLVALRGSLMQQAGTDHPGTMAAIIGMDDDIVEQVCKEASEFTGKPVVAANYNCPGQLVISGDITAVEKAVSIAQEKGCRMAKILPVSGAFHSPLMQPAYDGLKEKLESTEFKSPVCPVYSNFTAKATTDVDTIRKNVLKQLVNPVRWTQTMNAMKADGAGKFIEVGPGKVLQGLVKRTVSDAEISGYQ